MSHQVKGTSQSHWVHYLPDQTHTFLGWMCQQSRGSSPSRPSFTTFISFWSNQIKLNQIKKGKLKYCKIWECESRELNDFILSVLNKQEYISNIWLQVFKKHDSKHEQQKYFYKAGPWHVWVYRVWLKILKKCVIKVIDEAWHEIPAMNRHEHQNVYSVVRIFHSAELHSRVGPLFHLCLFLQY